MSFRPQIDTDDHCLPFPGRTGKGIRVAVIDSGVNSRHPHIATIAGGVSIEASGDAVEGSYLDLLGHGTAVMAAIQEKATEAEYFAVKLFHSSLRASGDQLLRALQWTIDQHMDVVNLSLGTSNQAYAGHIESMVGRASANGMLLVSAREAQGKPSFPGCLPGVLGVDVDWNCDRHRYRYEDTPSRSVFYCSGYPRPLPGIPRERNLHGISFAVANMTGVIVRACEATRHRTLEAMQQVLLTEATNCLMAR